MGSLVEPGWVAGDQSRTAGDARRRDGGGSEGGTFRVDEVETRGKCSRGDRGVGRSRWLPGARSGPRTRRRPRKTLTILIECSATRPMPTTRHHIPGLEQSTTKMFFLVLGAILNEL